MKAAIAGILVGALMAGMIVACGPIEDHRKPEKHNEILQLWMQIREFKSNMHLRLEPSAQALIAARQGTASDQRHRVCPDNHDVKPVCYDTCNLADDICDNAEQICKIASELPKDDTFAQSKCDDAKASCREGKQRCCDCGKDPQ